MRVDGGVRILEDNDIIKQQAVTAYEWVVKWK